MIKKEKFYSSFVSGCSQSSNFLSEPMEERNTKNIIKQDIEKLSNIDFFQNDP